MRNAEDTPPDGFARVGGPPGPVSSPPGRPPRRPAAPWGPAPQPPGAAPYEPEPGPRPAPADAAKGHHPACGQLLPGPVQYHQRRMIRYCQWARCLRRSQRPASRTRHHPARALRPTHRPRTHRASAHRPSAHRAGHPRTRRSAHRSRTRAVWPPPPPRWAQPCRRTRARTRARARSRTRGARRPGRPLPARPRGRESGLPPARPPGRESGLPPPLPSRWPGPRPAT